MNDAGDNNDDVKQVEIKARKDVLDAIDLECSFWRDKATFKLKWLKKGDKSSRPFHIFAKSKEARARIFLLKIWGFYTDKKEAIAGHIIDFYESLHSSNSESRDMSVCPLNQLPTDDIVQIHGISTISVLQYQFALYVILFIVRSRWIICLLVVALLVGFGNG